MNRIVILAVVGTAAIAAILVAHLALIPVAVLGLAAWFAWGRPLQPIAPAAASRRWATWVVAGAAGIAIAIAIPAIDGGELNAFWWTIMMLTLLSGIGLAISEELHRLGTRPHLVLALAIGMPHMHGERGRTKGLRVQGMFGRSDLERHRTARGHV